MAVEPVFASPPSQANMGPELAFVESEATPLQCVELIVRND